MIPLRDRNPTHHRPLVTLALIIANLAVFLFVQPLEGTERLDLPSGASVRIESDTRFTFQYAAIPCELTENRPLDVAEVRDAIRGGDSCADTSDPPLFPDKNVWLAALTSMFLHGSYLHIGANMLFLWIFGNNIEDHVGPIRYALFYVAAGIAALTGHIALQPDSAVPIIGASGAVAGVMGAYLVWFPHAPVTTLILLFIRDIRARWLLSIWFVTQFFTVPDSSVAWAAHVGGFVFGAIVGAVVRFVRPARRLMWRAPYDRWGTSRWDPTGGVGTDPARHIR